MKIVVNGLTTLLAYAAMAFVLFFDTDSALHLTTAPSALLTFGSVVGNVFWLLGIMFAVGMVGVLVLTFDHNTISKILFKRLDAGKELTPNTMTVWAKISVAVAAIIALLFTGSGYWFTGPMWLLFLASYQWYRFEYNQQVKKFSKMDDHQLNLRRALVGE